MVGYGGRQESLQVIVGCVVNFSSVGSDNGLSRHAFWSHRSLCRFVVWGWASCVGAGGFATGFVWIIDRRD